MYFVISTTYLQVASCTLSIQQRTYKSLHVLCQFNNVLTRCFMYFVISTTYLQVASCTLLFQQRTYKSLHVLCQFNNVLTLLSSPHHPQFLLLFQLPSAPLQRDAGSVLPRVTSTRCHYIQLRRF